MSVILATCCLVFLSATPVKCVKHYDSEYLATLREEVRQMFTHAYDSYLKYAFPYDELRPLSCDGVDTWGSYSLTLIDALDTLAIMGNYTEFRRVVDILLKNTDFVKNNINVSVFETNIRIIGGLLSAHLLSYRAGVQVEEGWPCNGPLLELAENVAQRLIAAFDTATGMPYGTVNLQSGVPHNETTVTCTAGVGTFILEFSTLSHLTGDPIYEELAMNALTALWHHRSDIGLVGNHIDIQTGRWTAQDSGIGAGVDSYFEYLVKGALFLQKPELMNMFKEYKKKIDKYLKTNDWYMWASMTKGQLSLLVFQSLEAYWPGVLSLIGHVNEAMKSLHNYHQVWKQYGFTPEFYSIPQSEAGAHRESYPLRPELIESVMYLYRATGDSYLLEVGEDILRSIQHSSYTPCGYATIKDVRDHRKEDRMESFFLAETTKYLYLLFDYENFMHNNGQHGTVLNTPWGECIIDAGGYFFNTEAHPIDVGALYCCSRQLQEEVKNVILNFDSTASRGLSLSSHKRKMLKKKKQMQPQTVANQKSESTPIKRGQSSKKSEEKEQELKDNSNAVANAFSAPLYEKENAETSGEEEEEEPEKKKKEKKKKKKKKGEDEEDEEEGYVTTAEYSRPLGDEDLNVLGKSGQTGEYLADEDQLNSSEFYEKEVDLEEGPEENLDESDWRPADDEEDEKINLSTILSLFSSGETKRTFEPQMLIEKIRRENKYLRNTTWETDYKSLKCYSQLFEARITLNGEFYGEP